MVKQLVRQQQHLIKILDLLGVVKEDLLHQEDIVQFKELITLMIQQQHHQEEHLKRKRVMHKQQVILILDIGVVVKILIIHHNMILYFKD